MTKIVDHIANAKGKTLFSCEILPPKRGEGIQTLFKNVEPLMDFKPAFVDVTYHREEFIFREHENGLLEKVAIKKRPGTVGICAALMNRFHIDTVPHIICGGFTKEETESALIDLQFLGIDNLLAIRGDAIKSESHFVPTPGGNTYASDLIGQISDMNSGNYLNDHIENSCPTDFCTGVAGYPEKHSESPNFNIDLDFLKKKIDMGAEYIVTQMFFDNSKYIDFVEKCRAHGIHVPIIPGLKPISTKTQLTILPSIFHIDVPSDLVEAVNGCKDNTEVRQVGIEWAIDQSKELKKVGVPSLHYYSMGKSDNIVKIAKEIF